MDQTAEKKEFIDCIFQYGIMTAALVVVGVLGFFLFLNPMTVKNNTIFYSFLMLIVVAIGFRVSAFLFGNKSEMSGITPLISATIAVVSILAIVYFWNAFVVKSFVTGQVVNWILGIAIVLFGLALVFSFAKKTVQSLQNEYSWSGFIAQFIFFIPCMIYDFVVYLAGQFNATPNVVYILFVVELALITLFFSSPYILNYLLNIKSTFLLSDAVFLTHKNLLSDSNPMILDNRKDENNIRSDYSLSMWVYINDHDRTPDRPAQTVFHYGDQGSQAGHPHIVYQDQQLVFTFTNKNPASPAETNPDTEYNESQYRMDIEPQNWVFLVFNYKQNEVDLFVNAELRKSVRFTDNVPEYHVSEIIYTGDKNGIDGAIANVIYYPFPQTVSDITAQYNILMFSNPPVYSTFLMNKKGGIPREL